MEETGRLAVTVPNFQVASADVGGAAAFDAFAASVADVFALALVGEMAVTEYQLTLSAWHLGTLMIGDFRSSALAFDRSGALTAAGGLDHLLIQLYVEGGFTGTADDRKLEVRAGDIVVFDLTRMLSTVTTPFRNISLLVPRTSFEDALEEVDCLHGMILHHETPLGGLLANYLESLVARLPQLTPADAIVSANATVGLAVTVLAAHAPRGLASASAVRSPFRKIALHIDANLHDARLNAESIAPIVGMSRASLYRLFEPVGGVAQYIRRRRLIRAALALATHTDRPRRIGEIAFEHGFTSEATFARAFNQAFGISPTIARSRASILLTAPAIDSSGRVDHRVFADWMRTLQA
ncbi:helix-turn-helix domain-containing protein [Sphingomonas sp. PB4P5]|uniref:helix-turn-helix domain-containing protein n=1 Tax=Parasphingomonas puruogangriensis TaxID=3096155 RepID=UPI002FC80C0A